MVRSVDGYNVANELELILLLNITIERIDLMTENILKRLNTSSDFSKKKSQLNIDKSIDVQNNVQLKVFIR